MLYPIGKGKINPLPRRDAINSSLTETEVTRRLRKLIGKRFVWEGQDALLVELLEDSKQLVFEVNDTRAPVQGDQYGNATRRQRRFIEVSLFDHESVLRPEVLELLSRGSSEGTFD